MTSAELPDADLVAGVLAGDRTAFAGVYEKYADRLHDFAFSMTRNREEAADAVADSFVVMAEKLGQLRDPSRLRPWLYSVVRNECLRTLRARARVAHDDEWLEAMPDDGHGPEAQVEQEAVRAELQTLVWDAIEGLNDRDRALLDLHLRQGLEGAELAEAMDVTASQSYVLLSRARDQVERALGALLIARRGSDDCDDLAAVLAGWDGTFSPLIRKRVARHIDGCEVCESRRRLMVSPLALLAGVPAFAAPAALKDRVLDDPRLVAFYAARADRTTPAGPRLRVPFVALIVALVVLGGWATVSCWPQEDTTIAVDAGTTTSAAATPSEPSTATTSTTPSGTASSSESASESDSESATDPTTEGTVAAPGELTVSTRTIDLGRADNARTLRVGNVGGTALTFSTDSRTSWLSVEQGGGLDPDTDRAVTITAARGGLSEGAHEGTIAIAWSGGTVLVTVRLTVNRPPVVGTITAGATSCDIPVSATVSDGSGVQSVTVRWSGAVNGQANATLSAGRWRTTIPVTVGGNVTVTFTATDRAGLTASRSRTFTFDPCPG